MKPHTPRPSARYSFACGSIEQRVSAAQRARLERVESELATLTFVGHAAVFDQWATIYDAPDWTMREVVRPGAFRNALREKQDVRALFNHDANLVLGRTRAGTLKLSEDRVGLLTEITVPGTALARDLAELIRRGDVNQMSFAFAVRSVPETVTQGHGGRTIIEDGGSRSTIWREGSRIIEERELLDLDIYDVSPVTVPAYHQTDVGVRTTPHPLLARAKAPSATPRRDRLARRLRLAELEATF